jgi:hypothetical protein
MLQKTNTWVLLCFLILSPGCLLAQNTTNASDERAIALADKVTKNMGGTKNWDNTRFIAWSWLGQYHIWDKYDNKFRYEKDTLVVISDLKTKKGTVYSKGQVLPDTAKSRQILNKQYAVWANNSYWLLMPFKLRDKGVTLKYKGAGKSQTGTDVELLELTFHAVGVTPNNRYILGIDKNAGLVTEWSFFRNATDEKPSFTRPWTDYQTYGRIKIASNRGDEKMSMQDIVVSQNLNSDLFNSPTPVNKELVK